MQLAPSELAENLVGTHRVPTKFSEFSDRSALMRSLAARVSGGEDFVLCNLHRMLVGLRAGCG